MQLDTIDAFVHTEFDKTMFMHMPLGYGKNGKVLCLNKSLYGLQQSPLLWQQNLTNEPKKLGFEEIPQEPYVVQKNGIIAFFYIDDIVFAYKNNQKEKGDWVVESL